MVWFTAIYKNAHYALLVEVFIDCSVVSYYLFYRSISTMNKLPLLSFIFLFYTQHVMTSQNDATICFEEYSQCFRCTVISCCILLNVCENTTRNPMPCLMSSAENNNVSQGSLQNQDVSGTSMCLCMPWYEARSTRRR